MFGPHKHWEFLTLHNSDLLQIGGHTMTGFPSQYQVCSHLALNRHHFMPEIYVGYVKSVKSLCMLF